MAIRINAPRGLSYAPLDSTAVMVQWLPPTEPIEGWELRGGGSPIVRSIPASDRTAVVRGLQPARFAIVEVRAVASGSVSEWAGVQVRSSHQPPLAPTDGVSVIPVIDADRQSVQLRLPRADGTIEDVRLTLWWSPSDNNWWASIEVPVNTPTIRSRNLPLNVGLFDDVGGVLAGNIVMRATGDDDESEPNRLSFVNATHQLRWEPA